MHHTYHSLNLPFYRANFKKTNQRAGFLILSNSACLVKGLCRAVWIRKLTLDLERYGEDRACTRIRWDTSTDAYYEC